MMQHSVRQWKTPLGAVLLAVPLAVSAADPTLFNDGFEGGSLAPFWTLEQPNGSVVFPVTGPVHSGSQSVGLASGVSGQKQVALSHTFAAPQYGKLSVWVYDNGDYIYFNVSAQNSASGRYAAIGVQDWDTSCFYFSPFEGGGGKSSVARSRAWHQFMIDAGVGALVLSIDGLVVSSTPGGTPFDRVVLTLSGPGGGSVWFDDFSFEAAPETTGIAITSLTSNGLLTWTNSEALANGMFTVEWAPSSTGAWRSNWNDLHNFMAPALSNTVNVPMLYRIKCLTNLLFPFPSRGQLVFSVTNALGNASIEQLTVLGAAKPTAAGGKEFALIEGLQGGGMGLRLMRSTDSSAYAFDQNTLSETLEFCRGPVGTTWTNYNHEGVWTIKAAIEAVETVTVPAGTFNNCYKFHKQALNSADANPEWYEWVAPGVGLVKWVDYWVPSSENPPVTHLLQSRGLVD